MMASIVVYNKESKDVLAVIPLDNNELGVCRNDIAFQRFDNTEPVLTETADGVKFNENAFIVKI